MRLILIRHGHPNYEKDCLTELGHLQAKAASERLKDENIDKFYASSCGRAYETALHIAEGRNMEVEKLDFMREIGWGPKGGSGENGYDPWTLSAKMVADGKSLLSKDWDKEEPFSLSFTTDRAITVGDEFDKFLCELGYTREGEFYRVGDVKYKNVLLASHGGSSTALLSRIFNLPMPFVSTAICPNFTAVTVINFSNEKGSLVSPKIEILNDARHIAEISVENVYGV